MSIKGVDTATSTLSALQVFNKETYTEIIMKLLIVLACVIYASCAPMEDDCLSFMTDDQCAQYDAIDLEILDQAVEETRERRQLPGVDVDQVLVALVKKKLQFLMNFGIIQRIPFLGQKIEDMIRNDPDGVAKALAGGIGGLIQLATKLLLGGLGR